jgi:signal peptidase I
MAATVEKASAGGWIQAVLIGRNPKRTAVRIIVLIAASLVLFRYVLLGIRVEGVSMMPTYRQGGVNFVNRVVYRFREPKRGDVVPIRTTGISNMLMKRIVALPGETIAFHQGHIFINGAELEEPYLKYKCDWELPPRTLGSSEYYFVGDNRSMAAYEHEHGVADRSRIVGKVLL